jgi:hypothetical protein
MPGRISYFIIITQFILYFNLINAQEHHNGSFSDSDSFFPVSLSGHDSLVIRQLPFLEYTSTALKKDLPELPSSLNNAELPYFRPIFSQGSFASCGQASGIAYNFTYMINRARGLSADVSENQYPTHYHWNFTNGGYGWYGSSYFHSFEILRTNGSPTIADYGGMDYGGDMRWMDGYEKYYNGMHNRIEGAYKIDVSTPEGLETLKHWLHNHLDGSETGGVASFYANASGYTHLPENTPEAGKPVIPSFWGLPSHAWVIVGYNDSIRYDVNNDGQYTNHLDINGDGMVDMRDWEIGGVWVANSYGENWAYNGFTFVLYRTLAESVFSGGIWDNSVHVLKVNHDYSPLLTSRIKLKHTSRGMIKIQMGVANDATLQLPQHIIEYPIFNFQGGNRFMQGGTGEEDKTIEIGLDITPLLDFVVPGEEAKFFLQISENDPQSLHEGEIVAFSIIDYSGNGPAEHAYSGSNIQLINNAVTTIGIAANPDFEKVQIDTGEFPAMIANETVTIQMEASGGFEPYQWDLLYNYSEHFAQYAGPVKSNLKSDTYPGWNQWESTDLDFGFPFFDSVYEKITAYVNGFIMFDELANPYPYWLEPKILFRSHECIAPFLARNLALKPDNGDQIWFEPFDDHIRINWKLTYEYGNYQLPLSFSAVLYESGNIEFHYEAITFEDHCIWLAGLSKGDGINYNTAALSGVQEISQNTAIGFTPIVLPDNLQVSENGLLSYFHVNSQQIYDVAIRVKDSRSITDQKSFQLSDRFVFEFAPIEETMIAGYDAAMGVMIKNISSEHITDISICFQTPTDGMITWHSPCFDSFDLGPGESKSFTEQGMFNISGNTPDNYLISINATLSWDGQSRNLTRHFNSKKSMLGFTSIILEGAVQNTVEPGESYTLKVALANYGDAVAGNVSLEILSGDPFIILYPPVTFAIGDLQPLSGHEVNAFIKIHPKALPGYTSTLKLRLSGENMIAFEKEYQFVIEGTKILIIDLDPMNRSASQISNATDHFGLASQQANKISPAINAYDIGFICLGSFPQRHVITDEDSKTLAEFLNAGGHLYIEGSATWRTDPRMPIHDMFGIEGKTQGYTFGIDSLAGYPGSFTEHYGFNYTGTNLRMDNMQPVNDDADILFTDVPSGLHYTIALENGMYKTIGSTFEFGGVYQHPDDVIPVSLMKDYLNFFELKTEALVANFTSDKQQICDGESIKFQTKSNVSAQNVLWEFEGGIPESSTDFEPTVKYATPGKWPVKLTVNDGNIADILIIDNYVSVDSCSGFKEKQPPELIIYPNPAQHQVTVYPQQNTPHSVVVKIYNLTGTLLLEVEMGLFSQQTPAIIDVTALKNGLYVIQVRSRETFWNSKLMILR